MAQLVKLEPGDILVIGNCGRLADEWDSNGRSSWLATLQRELKLRKILLFEGDVGLSSLPAGWMPDVAGA